MKSNNEDIYQLLVNDHHQVADLFEQLLSSQKPVERERLFQSIYDELLRHTYAENETFYKELQQFQEMQETLLSAQREHKGVEKMLEKLQRLPLSDDSWMVRFKELVHAVNHHVQEEEQEIFLKAKNLINNEKALMLAQQLLNLKNERAMAV